MSINRRNFLKAAAAGTATVGLAAVPCEVQARGNKEMPPQAVGFLFDSTLCVGCKACVTACKQANDIPFETPVREAYLDTSIDINSKALNVIKMYVDGKANVKDREADGFAFTKKSCMHCVDPSCVSVCPVSAMQKDPITGIVSHYKENCIGCRYCVASCPYGVPRFDYDSPFPQISKCQMCKHLQAEGKIPACADACPTGATLFGPVTALKEEARKRLATEPGTVVRHERRVVGSGDATRPVQSAAYVDHLYGDKELGGTQMVMLSGVSFDKLGMPQLPERSFASESETVQHTIYKGMIAPAVALAGLVAVVKRNKSKQAAEDHGEEE